MEDPSLAGERPYGERFLTAWRRYSGAMSSFDYATIQALKLADREEFIRALRSRNPMMPYGLIQLIRDCDPEEAARHIFMGHQQAMAAVFVALAL